MSFTALDIIFCYFHQYYISTIRLFLLTYKESTVIDLLLRLFNDCITICSCQLLCLFKISSWMIQRFVPLWLPISNDLLIKDFASTWKMHVV